MITTKDDCDYIIVPVGTRIFYTNSGSLKHWTEHTTRKVMIILARWGGDRSYGGERSYNRKNPQVLGSRHIHNEKEINRESTFTEPIFLLDLSMQKGEKRWDWCPMYVAAFQSKCKIFNKSEARPHLTPRNSTARSQK
jgi:hypothetical protein